jgi:FKBP-type peptidyl-prolyl cis-trans isomerase
MNKSIITYLFVLFALVGCSQNKSKTNNKPQKQEEVKAGNKDTTGNANPLTEFDAKHVQRKELLQNGLSIEWIASPVQSSPTIQDGEVCLVSYRLTLPDGKIIDGNNRVNLPFIPYMVGYNMQIKGWDLGLKSLRVGDFAKITIPAPLAYGAKGINKVIPPNSQVWLYVKILAKVTPDYNKNGLKYWIFNKGEAGPLDATEDKEVFYHAMASTKSNPNVQNTYQKHMPLSYIPGQRNVVNGLRGLLTQARQGQKIYALLAPNMAYGDAGLGQIVLPNETVFYNLTIESVREL